MKKCCSCKEIKEFSAFCKASNKPDGLHTQCRVCRSIYDKNRSPRPYIKRDLTPEQYCRKLAQQAVYREKIRSLKPIRKLKTKEEKLAKLRISNRRYEKNNIARRLCQRLRKRLKKTLNRHININFTGNTYIGNMIGCSGKDLVKHLESTWLQGMSWDNYGVSGWHIDHIRPMIDFVRKGEDPRLANHYTNLQALWAKDNIAKRDKI